eukprot:CAMPEP_0183360398 /NCGR_PEP_ID=MMETSP0164_2-20130417/55084_1 /TAXON_ID=221442 /ORGANISM="Coccolithus pelagicus ssp braarudi, Strain PLY182g" /LENGTH=72 /DNA_ID=CAMNT_0025534753 /DNA_START=200 /DNA_END=414 /DNA_ORIENTATION=+
MSKHSTSSTPPCRVVWARCSRLSTARLQTQERVLTAAGAEVGPTTRALPPSSCPSVANLDAKVLKRSAMRTP